MNFKEFLKPTIAKILLFIILMGGLNYYVISTTHILDGMALIGYPSGFWPTGSVYLKSAESVPAPLGFSCINFIIDLLFWYLISCLIILAYNKITNSFRK